VKNRWTIFAGWLLLLGGVVLLPGCRTEETAKPQQKPQPVNAFSMYLNGRYWEPSGVGNDPCQRTFNGAWSAVTNANHDRTPYYTVWASRDRGGVTSWGSENALEFQVMGLDKAGRYPVTGSYRQEFTSYAVFNLNSPGSAPKRYVNRAEDASFVVTVREVLEPLPGGVINGIRGSFTGTLYNEVDPRDSVTITRGAFVLKKVNWYNFDQCAP
jgi:hypothetical protein